MLSISLAATAVAADDATDTEIEGTISGVELCTQNICGAAILRGTFNGSVDGKPAFGYWSARVKHESPLPPLGESINILVDGSRWKMHVVVIKGFYLFPIFRTFPGDFQPGGTITQSSPDIFTVLGWLNILFGGTGSISMEALLDHRYLPFRI